MAERRGSGLRALRRHFLRRLDPFTSAILAFPLFVTYQAGILLGARGRNGVDFISDALIRLSNRDFSTYLQLLAAMVTTYGVSLWWLKRSGGFHPRAFVPMIVEASVYAFFMGGVIQLVMSRLGEIIPLLAIGSATLGEIATVSAGAGLHEELVFRVGLMGGLIRLGSASFIPFKRQLAFGVALIVSSLVFSWVHHLGPAGESFTTVAFVYRSLAGIIFGLVYYLRGFAVAAWTHTLYDVFVFTLG